MGVQELKKTWKTEVINIFLSFVVAAGVYYYINSVSEVGGWFLPIMFMLILIYLNLPSKK